MSSVRQDLPNVGEKLVLGRLRSMGYHVTRERVRQAIRAIDPINSALRWQGVFTPRHPYSVPGPNSLWHIGLCICVYVIKHTVTSYSYLYIHTVPA